MAKVKSALQPGMLSFARSLEITEAVMSGINSHTDMRMPVEVVETGQRGQTSQENENDKDPGKTVAGKSNPQMTQIARLPVGADKLSVSVDIRVLPNARQPASTDSPEAREAYRDLFDSYVKRGGMTVLAERYAENIACGRFSWRNRTLSDSAAVIVEFGDRKLVFDPFKLQPGGFLGRDGMAAALIEGTRDGLDTLIDHIAKGLSDEPRNLHVEWVGDVLPNAEVYPSQEYKFSNEDKSAKEHSGAPAKLLSSIKSWDGDKQIRQATMHSQKIGAAIRAIDDWHQNNYYGAIPVNPYGGIQEAGLTLRHQNKNAPSFYDLARKPELMTEGGHGPDGINPNMHFFVANLIRGGVFGASSD